MSHANPFLSPKSPIEPLGILSKNFSPHGLQVVVISTLRSAIRLDMDKLGKSNLIAICGGDNWLKGEFPQYSKPLHQLDLGCWKVTTQPELIGFDQAEASKALITACCMRGLVRFDMNELLDAQGNVIWPRPDQGAA